MEIKKKMFLIPFILIVTIVSGQNLSKKEKESFLIGMFNYCGGNVNISKHPTLDKRITYFFKGKEKLIKVFSDTLNKYSLEYNVKFEIKDNQFTEVYLRDKVNPFEKYFKKIKSNYTYFDEQRNKDYIVYSFELRKKTLLNENQKLYFLLGAFINCGKINPKGEYIYSYPNEKYLDYIIYLLNNLDEKIIKISTNTDNTPSGKSVIFCPTDKLKKILNNNKKLWE